MDGREVDDEDSELPKFHKRASVSSKDAAQL